MTSDRMEMELLIDNGKIGNVHQSSAVRNYGVKSIFLILLSIITLILLISHFYAGSEDNSQMLADIQNNIEKIRERLDQAEITSSQLKEKVSIMNKEMNISNVIKDAIEKKVLALEHTYNLKTEHLAEYHRTQFTDIRKETDKIRGRLDQGENAASQLAEKVSSEDKKIESVAERIRTDMKHLRETLADLNHTQSTDSHRIFSETEEIRGRLDREENTSSQLTERVSIMDKEVNISNVIKDAIEKKVLALEHTYNLKTEHFEEYHRAQSSAIERISFETEKLRGRLDRDESISSQVVEKISTAEKKIEANSEFIRAGTAERNALKNQFADIQNETAETHRRINLYENISSNIVERVSSDDEKIINLTERIRAQEVKSDKLINLTESMTLLLIGTGKVDWILDNYKSVDDASSNFNFVTKEGPSLHTKGFGYKLGIRYHQAADRYFVSIRPLEGVFDKLLKWPVAGNISITFVDQNHAPPVEGESAVHRSFIFDDSDPCKKIYEYYFDPQHQNVCRFELLPRKNIRNTKLIKNNSLHIRVEVVTN